jgi:hypothetical protein
VNTKDILSAIRRNHPDTDWLYAEEVRCGTGIDYGATFGRRTAHGYGEHWSTWTLCGGE